MVRHEGSVYFDPKAGFYQCREVINDIYWLSGPTAFYSDAHTRVGTAPFSPDFVLGLIPVTAIDTLPNVAVSPGLGWHWVKPEEADLEREGTE